jgi:hypothetical protein
MWMLEGAAENGDISSLRAWITRRFLCRQNEHPLGVWSSQGVAGGHRPTEHLAPGAPSRLPALVAVYDCTPRAINMLTVNKINPQPVVSPDRNVEKRPVRLL